VREERRERNKKERERKRGREEAGRVCVCVREKKKKWEEREREKKLRQLEEERLPHTPCGAGGWTTTAGVHGCDPAAAAPAPDSPRLAPLAAVPPPRERSLGGAQRRVVSSDADGDVDIDCVCVCV